MKPITLCLAALTVLLTACSSAPKAPPASERTPIMCTQDVLQCPDGRFVGRTPPGCVFMCPAATTPPPVR